MRPVNLIPADERRGDSAPLRTGKLVYVLVAGMALLLLGVVAVALTSKQISDREATKAGLQQDLDQATARANSLAAFSSFRAMQESRAATVSSLAQSRFDWDRVMRELSLVLPSDISLSNLTGTVSSDVEIESSGGSGASGGTDLRSGISGPALEISGCAPGQDVVAGFVASLEDIDGATRVGLDSSGISDSASGTSSGGSSDGGGTDCTAGGQRPFQFHIVVAFDAVPTPSSATTAPSVPPAIAPPSGDQTQVADAETQNQQNIINASVNEKTAKAKNAAKNLIPGG
jgi:Tfp pilus assembly protein PilN